MKAVFIPIDNRPVCYQMPEMIADICKDTELFIPPVELLGSLDKYAKVSSLIEWLKLNSKDADKIILSLDTLAYGGLIPSRRCPETFEEIKNRIFELKNILKNCNAKIYAFSSVMRISNNNINQEEKEYWNLYGEKIFKYSYETHKYGKSEEKIPPEILEDYLNTRKRNFEINKIYLEWQKEGLFDTLIFSKDDCAEYGLNVLEAKELENLGGFTKTGADEIPLTLLARAVEINVKVCPIFIEPDSKDLISNYEDISVEKSVKGQLELAGCEISNEENSDVLLYVNNFKNHQGEIVMKKETEQYNGTWETPKKPYIIADVRNANGSDNSFVDNLFSKGLDKNFLGYSAWNTTANTLGSLICAMKFAVYAKQNNTFNETAFKNFEALRFLDDWAYQANVRQQLNNPDKALLASIIMPYENKIKKQIGTEFSAQYSFPWDRLFEVKVELN